MLNLLCRREAQPTKIMSSTIKIKETIEIYVNHGNPSHPCNGQKILTVSVMEISDWGDDIIKNFGGTFGQDDAKVRAEALAYARNQALADAEYFNRYQEFVHRMEKTEWEY